MFYISLHIVNLEFLASGAASKPSLDVPQPGPLEQSQSHKRLRESSPKWKEHYSKLSQQWTSGWSYNVQYTVGTFERAISDIRDVQLSRILNKNILGVSLAQQESNVVWEDVRQRKEKGGYPWTHLSHHQDEEVWLNPQKLPQDIGRYDRKAYIIELISSFIYNLHLTKYQYHWISIFAPYFCINQQCLDI